VKNLINLLVGGAILALLVYIFAPGLWTKAEKTYQENFAWTEEAKRRDPVRYLEHILEKTRREYAKIDQYIGDYRSSVRRLDKERMKAQNKVDATNGLLGELKLLYEKVKAGEASWPVEFRGGSYNEKQLRTQVGTLLSERDAQSRVLKKLNNKIQQMTKKLDKIRTARAEYESKISTLEGDLVIAKASIGSSELDDLIDKADEILAYVDESSTALETPLRTTEELLDTESDVKDDKKRQQVDAFLDG